MVGREGSIMPDNDKSGFVDQQFKVTEQQFIPPSPPAGADPEVTPPLEGLIPSPVSPGLDILIPEDTLWASEILLNELPALIYPNMPPRRPEQISQFNSALVRYCNKHGIDLAAYLFEEIGLVFMVGSLLASYRRDYVEFCKNDKAKTKEDEMNKDYDKSKELDEQRTADVSEV